MSDTSNPEPRGEPDLIEQIEELQVLLEDAKAVPLSASAVVNREEVLDLLAALKDSVPDEVRRARWMLRDHEELLDRARRKAEDLLAEADRERERRVAEAAVVSSAQQRAEAIIEEAAGRAERMEREAQEYIDGKLKAFEELLDRTRATVSKGRERLRGRPSTDPEVEEARAVVFDADQPSHKLTS